MYTSYKNACSHVLAEVGWYRRVCWERAQVAAAKEFDRLVGEGTVGRLDRGIHRVEVVLDAVVFFNQRPDLFLEEILVVAKFADFAPVAHKVSELRPIPAAPHPAEDGDDVLVVVAHGVEALAALQPFGDRCRFARVQPAVAVTDERDLDLRIADRFKAPE